MYECGKDVWSKFPYSKLGPVEEGERQEERPSDTIYY